MKRKYRTSSTCSGTKKKVAVILAVMSLVVSVFAILGCSRNREPIPSRDLEVAPGHGISGVYAMVDGFRSYIGRIEGGLSFEDGSSVSKEEVEAYFGRLDTATNGVEIGSHALARTPMCISVQGGMEELRYLDKGITFFVASNTVTSFQVYSPVTPVSRICEEHRGQP